MGRAGFLALPRGARPPSRVLAAAFTSGMAPAPGCLRAWDLRRAWYISSRRRNSRFGLRLRRVDRAWAKTMGAATVESEYTTTWFLSMLACTLPQLMASEGVAPERPPHCGESVEICSTYSWPPRFRSRICQSVGWVWR